MTNKDIQYWVGFSLISSIGCVRLTQLENYFTNLEDTWKASPAELKQASLDSGSMWAIISRRPKISLEAEVEKLDRYGVKVLKGLVKQVGAMNYLLAREAREGYRVKVD